MPQISTHYTLLMLGVQKLEGHYKRRRKGEFSLRYNFTHAASAGP